MQTVEQLKATLALHKEELREKFKVKEIGLFGSYVRREQKKKSDVDVLVTFYETIQTFSHLLNLKITCQIFSGLKLTLS